MFKTYYIASKISVLSSHQLVLKLFQLADLVCVYVCIRVCVCVRLSGVGDVCVCTHVCMWVQCWSCLFSFLWSELLVVIDIVAVYIWILYSALNSVLCKRFTFYRYSTTIIIRVKKLKGKTWSYQAECVSSRDHAAIAAMRSCDASWLPPSLAHPPLSLEIWFSWKGISK